MLLHLHTQLVILPPRAGSSKLLIPRDFHLGTARISKKLRTTTVSSVYTERWRSDTEAILKRAHARNWGLALKKQPQADRLFHPLSLSIQTIGQRNPSFLRLKAKSAGEMMAPALLCLLMFFLSEIPEL